MALRLIEMVLAEETGKEARTLLEGFMVLEHLQLRLASGDFLMRVLLDAEQSEAVLDALEKQYSGEEGWRVVVLPVEATVPRADPEPAPPPEQTRVEEVPPQRIGREELYEDIKDAARCSWVYMAMVVLSTIVAAVGLYYDSVALIIGAMVIAPLLGPNVAVSLGTTLGDLSLLRRALVTVATGVVATMVLSAVIGALIHVDPTTPEVVSRTAVGAGDVAVALASGCAGALAFTTGVSAAVIGVMVAVAILPPLVAFGLLLGGGQMALAIGALSFFLMNLICVNLAGVTTFLAQGIRPATWWEKNQAAKATCIAIGLWAVLLVGLGGVILLLQRS